MRGHFELPSEQRLRSGGAEADDDAWFDQGNLGIEPRAARRDFRRARLLVNPPLAARLPLEMLDDVGDVGRRPVDARGFQRAIEKLDRKSVV